MGVITIPTSLISASLIADNDRQAVHFANGGYESESIEAWCRMVVPGSTVIDVGAYTGLYSILAAKLDADVIALEPMPANMWRLACNAELNRVWDRRIKAIRAGASDRAGPARLFFNRKVPLTSGASMEMLALHNDSIEIELVEIDALASDCRVSAIKIDVERHEEAVIKGARRTIERDRPMLLVETLDADYRSKVLELLPGYDAVAILDGRNTLFAPQGESRWASRLPVLPT